MKRPILISVLLAAVVLLTACDRFPLNFGGDDTPEAAGTVSAGTVYREVPLLPAETLESLTVGAAPGSGKWTAAYGTEEGIFCKGYVSDGDGGLQCIIGQFDWDGNYMGSRPAPAYGENAMFGTTADEFWMEDGGAVFLHWDYSADTGYIVRVRADGTVLHRLEIEDFNRNVDVLACAPDGESIAFFHDYSTTLRVYNASLELQREVFLSGPVNTMTWGTDGKLYLRDMWSRLQCCDPVSGTLTPVMENSSAGSAQYYGGGYDLYLARDDGLFGLTGNEDGVLSEENAVLLLDWAPSGMRMDATRILYIHDAAAFLVRSGNNLEGENRYVLLRPLTEAEAAQGSAAEADIPRVKEEVVLMTTYLSKDQEILIANFNQTSEAYYIRAELRTDLPQMKDPLKLQQFMTELSEDGFPDIFLLSISEQHLYSVLREQGYLTDLTALTDGMTESAKAAAMQGESCTRLPLTLRYRTLLTRAETLPQPLTIESMLQLAQTTPEDSALFTTPYLINRMYACLQSAFIDPDAEACSLDNETFRQYLEFMKDASSYIRSDYGYLQDTASIPEITNPELPRYLQDGTVVFCEYFLDSAGALGRIKLLYGDVPFTIAGYPEIPALGEMSCYAVVMQDGRCGDGALAFLEYYTSEAVQSSQLITDSGFPVNAAAMEAGLTYNYYYYTSEQDLSIRSTDPLDPELREMQYANRKEILFTEEDKAMLRALAENEETGRIRDVNIEVILWEDLAPYLAGDRSIDDTIDILESRIGIYLAE